MSVALLHSPTFTRLHGPTYRPPQGLLRSTHAAKLGPHFLPQHRARVAPHAEAVQPAPTAPKALEIVTKPPTQSEVEKMVNRLTWMALELPVLTAVVGLGKLANSAGGTYANIIGAKVLVSRELRVQDAALSVGLSVAGGILSLCENQWAQALEKVCQEHCTRWFAEHPGGSTPAHQAQNASTYAALDNLAYQQAWQLAGTAGVVGSLISSLTATVGNQDSPVSMPIFAAMVGLSVVRQGIDFWWTQRNQARRTTLNLEASRANFSMVQASADRGVDGASEAVKILDRNRSQRYDLQRANLAVNVAQDAFAVAAYCTVMQQLGWFNPAHTTVENLVGIQACMTAVRSLVDSVLTVPSFMMQVVQMRNLTRTYLQEQVPDGS